MKARMGHIAAWVRVSNLHDLSKQVDLKLLVDTRSTYTWVKSDTLRSLGIEPIGERKFKTIEGRVIERPIGEAVVECLGRRATTIVVFARDSGSEVLGVHALRRARAGSRPGN